MRAYEFLIEHPSRREPIITLRQLHKIKKLKQAQMAEEETRAHLIANMYGQEVDEGKAHDKAMNAIELERERVELAKDKAELVNIRTEQGTDSFKAIKRMSRSAMRQRKK